MQGALAYRISFVAGLIVFAIFAYGAAQPIAPCGDVNAKPAIVHFELARSVDDLRRIFGPPLNGCTKCSAQEVAHLPDKLDAANWADMLGIIPGYGIFLIFFFLAGRDPRLWRVGVAIALIACLADYVEDYDLAYLSHNHTVQTVWLAQLPWATGVKWIGVALAGFAASVVLGRRGGWNWGWALIGAGGLACTIAAIAWRGNYIPLAQASSAIWPVLLVVDAQGSFNRA